MSDYQAHQVRCPDRDCKTIFEVQAKQTSIQQTNYTSCPTCGEEMRFPKSGYWAIDNASRVAVGGW